MTRPDSSETKPIGVGIIGMGFMGWQHARSYVAPAGAGSNCRIVAFCDPDISRRIPPPEYADIGERIGSASMYTSADELLSDPNVELVSICTHTDSHVELAIRAIAAGKHVLVEKPVALEADHVRPLADVVATSRTLCMPAHCMRFWPGWDWLRDIIRSQIYGRVQSAAFQRIGPPPSWSAGFYTDTARSGGALTDLHIHDADIINWIFGMPAAVCCTGSNRHTTTLYRYAPDHQYAPPHVVAEAGWTRSATAGFAMRFAVDFENATAEFDSSRTDAPLLVSDADGTRGIDLPAGNGYDHQARHIISAISQLRDGKMPELRVTIPDSLATAALLDAERTSLNTNKGWVTPTV